MKRKSAELKRMARETLNKHYGVPMGAFVVAELIQAGLLLPFSWNVDLNAAGLTRDMVIYYIASIAISLIAVVLSVGIMKIALLMVRKQEYKFSDLFYGFSHHPDKYILATLLLLAIAILWMVPMIVVIVAAELLVENVIVGAIIETIISIATVVLIMIVIFRYMLVNFLLLDYPELKVKAAFKQSARLMKGNKWRYFYIMLSFIGWTILGALSLGIGMLWIGPYIVQTQTNFYMDVMGEIDKIQQAVGSKQQDVQSESDHDITEKVTMADFL